jgi:hypothetical protein
MVTTSSSSIDDDVLLGANQEKAHAATHDVASSSAIPQRRCSVPS